MKRLRPLILAWAGLLALLLLQVAAATLLHLPASAPVFGLAATSLVLVAFMRVRSGSPLMGIFGAAGLFWFIILLGLGLMDPATRTDFPSPTDQTP